MKTVNEALEELAIITRPFDESAAAYFREMKKCSPQEIANDEKIWGNKGSLMDRRIYGQSRNIQRVFERAAIVLGQALMDSGFNNPQTDNWITVFQKLEND